MMQKIYNVAIIVVFYNPTSYIIYKWQKFIASNEYYRFIFVDNSAVKNDFSESGSLSYIPLLSNRGIAYAQNVGISEAKRLGVEYVIFFDQDSDVSGNFIIDLEREYVKIKENVSELVMLGPTILNKETNSFYKDNNIYNNDGYSIVSFLISSGSIAELKSFDKIGQFEEGLFIDYVDFEWCWRANSLNYKCAKTIRVVLPHKVGQKDIKLFGYPIVISSPFRYFYQYRNAIILFSRSYVPRVWKINTIIRRLYELLFVPFIAKEKVKTFKYMLKGIHAGVKYKK